MMAEFAPTTASLARLKGVFCDIDGTITTAGRMCAGAYSALERLHEAALLVIPVTGRPAGWCDLIARFWPVAAVVGENGALYFRYDHDRRRMVRSFARTDAERARDRERLRAIAEEVLREVPRARITADQAYRDTDLAIDWCEDVTPLPRDDVDRIVALLCAHGLTVKVSSIHVNAWFGTHDKLTMARRLMAEQFGIDLDAAREEFASIGDSPNDMPMLTYFPNAFAVANIRAFGPALVHPRVHVIDEAEGAGFAVFAERLLTARAACRARP
jgi:HAD superfamily hydrolase (TIGR01484 family)